MKTADIPGSHVPHGALIDMRVFITVIATGLVRLLGFFRGNNRPNFRLKQGALQEITGSTSDKAVQLAYGKCLNRSLNTSRERTKYPVSLKFALHWRNSDRSLYQRINIGLNEIEEHIFTPKK